MARLAVVLPKRLIPDPLWLVSFRNINMSCLVVFKMALAMMRLVVSPILIGWTPGFLLRAIRWLAISGATIAGSTSSVHSRRAVAAREWHSSEDADLNDVHSLLQLSASTPEGPAAPLVHKAADMIIPASRDSNRTG